MPNEEEYTKVVVMNAPTDIPYHVTILHPAQTPVATGIAMPDKAQVARIPDAMADDVSIPLVHDNSDMAPLLAFLTAPSTNEAWSIRKNTPPTPSTKNGNANKHDSTETGTTAKNSAT